MTPFYPRSRHIHNVGIALHVMPASNVHRVALHTCPPLARSWVAPSLVVCRRLHPTSPTPSSGEQQVEPRPPHYRPPTCTPHCTAPASPPPHSATRPLSPLVLHTTPTLSSFMDRSMEMVVIVDRPLLLRLLCLAPVGEPAHVLAHFVPACSTQDDRHTTSGATPHQGSSTASGPGCMLSGRQWWPAPPHSKGKMQKPWMAMVSSTP